MQMLEHFVCHLSNGSIRDLHKLHVFQMWAWAFADGLDFAVHECLGEYQLSM